VLLRVTSEPASCYRPSLALAEADGTQCRLELASGLGLRLQGGWIGRRFKAGARANRVFIGHVWFLRTYGPATGLRDIWQHLTARR
jgi:hypothetical protein